MIDKTETINGGQNNIYSLNPVCIYVLTIVVITHIKYQLSITNPREEQYKLKLAFVKYLLGLAIYKTIVIHNKIKKKGLLHQFLYPFLTMTETAFSKVVKRNFKLIY